MATPLRATATCFDSAWSPADSRVIKRRLESLCVLEALAPAQHSLWDTPPPTPSPQWGQSSLWSTAVKGVERSLPPTTSPAHLLPLQVKVGDAAPQEDSAAGPPELLCQRLIREAGQGKTPPPRPLLLCFWDDLRRLLG